MSLRRVRAVAERVARGFRRDRRSLGLLIVAPVVVLSIVGAVWGTATNRVPDVVIATDRLALPAPIVDRFVSSNAIHGRRAAFEEGMRQLRSSQADAVVWLEGTTLHIEIEGADPLQSGAVAGPVQKALVDAVGGGSAFGAPNVQVDQLYGGPNYSLLDYVAPVLIGFFAFFFIFLLSAVSFLRERTSGTLERLLATPLRRVELVLGYLGGFSVFALLQAVVILAFTVFVLRVQYRGNLATVFIVEAVLVVGAVSLGLLVSAAARNELQAVQFVPLVLLPQVFLSGLLIPVDQLPEYLRPFASVLPLTYANEALRLVMIKGYELGDPLVVRDIAILVGFGLLMALGAVASIRREVA